jgi:hypothetical protein
LSFWPVPLELLQLLSSLCTFLFTSFWCL